MERKFDIGMNNSALQGLEKHKSMNLKGFNTHPTEIYGKFPLYFMEFFRLLNCIRQGKIIDPQLSNYQSFGIIYFNLF